METRKMFGFLGMFVLSLARAASLDTECSVDVDCEVDYYCDPVLSLCDSCQRLCAHPRQKPFCDAHCSDYIQKPSIDPYTPPTTAAHTEDPVVRPQAISSGKDTRDAHSSPVLVASLLFAGVFLVACCVVIVGWSRGTCTFYKTRRPIMQETNVDGGPSIYKPFSDRSDVIRKPKQEESALRGSREELAANTARRPHAITIAAGTNQASRLAEHTECPLLAPPGMPARVHTVRRASQHHVAGTGQSQNEARAEDQLLSEPSNCRGDNDE